MRRLALLLCAFLSLHATTRQISTFGACGGGDQTSNVQAALNATANNDTLQFDCLPLVDSVSISGRSNITLEGVSGGGLQARVDADPDDDYLLLVDSCTSCVIQDMLFEGDFKEIIPFGVWDSTNTTVQRNIIQNVPSPVFAGFVAMHNTGNTYTGNEMYDVGMDLSPFAGNTARGFWIGNTSPETREDNALITSNHFEDISGTAIALHGSGNTASSNTFARLNGTCIKVLPLGGVGNTLLAQNNCSGAGAEHSIGGDLYTEYLGSSNETTRIEDNLVYGYGPGDLARIPVPEPGAGAGIRIAGAASEISHNIEVIHNTVRNIFFHSVEVTTPIDGLLIERNTIDRDANLNRMDAAIQFQVDGGKTQTNITVRDNLIKDATEYGVDIVGSAGVVDNLLIQGNSFVDIGINGIRIRPGGGLDVQDVSLTGNCYTGIAGATIVDDRSILSPEAESGSCPNPTGPAISTTTLPNGQAGGVYSQTLIISGGVPPVTCALTAGSLSGSGLTLNSDCTITGTGATPAAYNFSVTPTDANSIAGTPRALSITIEAPPSFTGTKLSGTFTGVSVQ